ncbi:MAG: type II secretion system F family protein [Nocardioidaceae bacterium]
MIVDGWLLATVGCAAGAVAAWCAGPPRGLLRSRLGEPGSRSPAAVPRLRQAVLPALAGVVVLLVWGSRFLVPAATLAVVAAFGLRLAAGHRTRDQAGRRRREAVEACDGLAAELRAGQPAVRALSRVAAEHPFLAPAAQSAGLGGDVPGVLDGLAERPGFAGLRMVAAAWRVADRSGAGLAVVLDRVSAALRAEQACADEVSASLGPPRATARLLAVLPVMGLVLGVGIGGDPVAFLFGTAPGNVCLALGCALALTGVWWVERLAARVER